MRRKLRRGSLLGDLQSGGHFGGSTSVPAPLVPPSKPQEVGIGDVGTPNLDQAVVGDLARSVIQIPFDDSIDGTHPLECFFQMPAGVIRVKSAKVWVTRKDFRQYVSASSSSLASTTTHIHGIDAAFSVARGTTVSQSASNTSATSMQQQNVGSLPDHSHTGNFTGATTGASPLLGSTYHYHNDNHSHAMAHTHGQETFNVTTTESTQHTHTVTTNLTPGIYETAKSGTLSLYVSNDGVPTYGAAIVSGLTAIVGAEVIPSLTNSPGDKYIKIVGTGLCRVQVLLVLDLVLQLGA